MKNSTRFATLTMTAALVLAACSSGGTAQTAAGTTAEVPQSAQREDTSPSAQATPDKAIYNWKLGSVDSTSNPNYKAFQHFNELLDQKAPGKWNITIYPDSQLGDGGQQVESIQMGTL